MSKVFTSYKVKDMELKNRIVMAPMCMYMSTNEDGMANDFHEIHYITRAVGGVGLIILEATAVSENGRITDTDLGIWSDEHIYPLKRIVDGCHKYGAKVGIQLAHSGRKSEVLSLESIAPSPIAFDSTYRVPKEMTKEDIKSVVEDFREGARRADIAGFDTIEIHGAHGYLISEFLSPLSNTRSDEYGGSDENRSRILKEILVAVKSVWPSNKPIIVRVSASDYSVGGMTPGMISDILNLVKEEGIDLVDVSSGGVVKARIDAEQGYQVGFSKEIKELTNLPTIAGGLIKTLDYCEGVLERNEGDLIFIGRELLINPYLVLSMGRGKEVEGLFIDSYSSVKK